MRTLSDMRSERRVPVEVDRPLSDYWGRSQWHSHGVKEREPERGPQTIHDLFAASGGNPAGPLYAELQAPAIRGQMYAETMRMRIERLVQIYRDLEHVHSKRQDAQTQDRMHLVIQWVSTALQEQDQQDLLDRNTPMFKNREEGRIVHAYKSPGQERMSGPALFVLTRTYLELSDLVLGLVGTYGRVNPMFTYNMATEDSKFLRTFWGPTPRPAYNGSGPDCNGNSLGFSHRYASGVDARPRAVIRPDESQRRVVRRYYPEDMSGRWDIGASWSEFQSAPYSARWQTTGGFFQTTPPTVTPDDPVHNAGISGDHFVCCQMPRDHPGCFVDTYSEKTNQPVRYKVLRMRRWKTVRLVQRSDDAEIAQPAASIRAAWNPVRRGTAWLDKMPYDRIHAEILTVKKDLTPVIVAAYRTATNAAEFFAVLEASDMNKLVRLLRLQDAYNSYWKCGDPVPTSPFGWMKRIAHWLLLDRAEPLAYNVFVRLLERIPELNKPVYDTYATVFSSALVTVLQQVAPRAAAAAGLSVDEEEEEEEGGVTPPLSPPLTPLTPPLTPFGEFEAFERADRVLNSALLPEELAEVTAITLYPMAEAVSAKASARAFDIRGSGGAESDNLATSLQTVAVRVLQTGTIIHDAVRIQVAGIAAPGGYGGLKAAAAEVVAKLRDTLRALDRMIPAENEPFVPAMMLERATSLEERSARLIPVPGLKAPGNPRFEALNTTDVPDVPIALAMIAAARGGGGGGGEGGGGGGASESPGTVLVPATPTPSEEETPLPAFPSLEPGTTPLPPTVPAEEGEGRVKPEQVIPPVNDKDIADERVALDVLDKRDNALLATMGMMPITRVEKLYTEIDILNQARSNFWDRLAATSGVPAQQITDLRNLAGNIVLLSTRKASNLGPAFVRLEVAETLWGGRGAGGRPETLQLLNALTGYVEVSRAALDATAGREFTPDFTVETGVKLVDLYNKIFGLLPAADIAAQYRDDRVLFDPLGPADAVAFDLAEFSGYLVRNPDATKGDPRQRYWKEAAASPNIDVINKDIDIVLRTFGVARGGGESIMVPTTLGSAKLLGLGEATTSMLFRKGATTGSLATKSGFAIKRDSAQWIVQRLREYDLRTGREPVPDSNTFDIRIGWTAVPPRAAWRPLAIFAQSYARFVRYVAKMRRGDDATAELSDVKRELTPSALTGKKSPMQLEEWLHDSYVELARPDGGRAVPDGQEKIIKLEPNQAAIPNLGAYIAVGDGDDTTVDDWDATPVSQSGGAAVNPPALAETDWRDWE
jgi:hypothetical protein